MCAITSIKEGLTLTTFEAMSMELPLSALMSVDNEVVSEKQDSDKMFTG